MLILVCPTCERLLGNIQIDFEKKCSKIKANTKLSKEEQEEEIRKLIKSYELNPFCCVPKLLNYIKISEVVSL